MTTYKLKNSIFPLLLMSVIFTSCNGQSSTIRNTNNQTEQEPKLVRTLGAKNENISCELLDKDGNLWFSIKGEGAYRYDGKSFTNFTTKDGLCNNNVGSIIQDSAGNILLGTNRGICKYDGNKFTQFPIPDTLGITCMIEDKDGNIWFGTWTNGIYRYNGKTLDNFLNSNNQEYNLGRNKQLILDILQDKNGNLWFSSWNGGGVWRYDGKEFKNFHPPADYYKANQDKRNFNNPKITFENSLSTNYSPSKDHITDDMIFSMTEDNAGNIWFTTRDHGICYYDGKTFKNFTENDGLVNNAVMNIMIDKNGHVWFGTKSFGLSRYDGKIFTTFSTYDN